MSERHITITAANLHDSDPTGIDLETPIGSARDLVIHAPAVRGIYLPLRITYHESDRSPTARSATFVVQTKAHPTVFEFTLPDWVRRVTIFIPPIPRGAQVLEGEPVVFPGRDEVDGTAATTLNGTSLTTVDVSGLTFGSDDEPQEMGLVKDIRARIATTRGEIDINPNDSAVFVMDPDGGGGRLVSIDVSSIALDESVADKELVTELEASSVSHAIDDIIRTRGRLNKSGWRALAEERGKELDRVAGVLGRSRTRNAALRHRATDLGDAARTLHERLGERSEAMRAAQRDAAMLERRVAELTNRNERQGATIVKQAQERDDARALNTANARRIEEMTAQIASLTNALADDRESKHQEQTARQTAEQNVREATDALEQMQEQRDEARAERDNAQAEHAQSLADHDVTRSELAQARDAIDTLGARPAITNDVAEALNGVLRLVEHEGGNADGVSLVEALRLAAQQWEDAITSRNAAVEVRDQAMQLVWGVENALPEIEGETHLVNRAQKLAEWCKERETLREALKMSDGMLTERDAEIVALREELDELEQGPWAGNQAEQSFLVTALHALRNRDTVEIGGMKIAPCDTFGRTSGERHAEGEPGPLLSEIAIDPHALARMGRIELNVGGGRVVFVVKHRPHPTYRHVNAPCMVSPEFAPGGIITRPRQAGKTAEAFVRGGIGGGIDAMGLIAKLAPELVLETLGVNRKTYTRTVENLRRARSENRTLRSALRGVDRYVATALDPWRE